MDRQMRIRSSIACLRCRKSKIKCDNTGRLDEPCEYCAKNGRKCQWPSPEQSLQAKPSIAVRPTASEVVDVHNDHIPKKRKGSKQASTSDLTAELRHQVQDDKHVVQSISRGMWNEIIETYQRHFTTELPFIHIPTLKKSIYDSKVGESSVASDAHLVLLGLLALTGRYHPELYQYIPIRKGATALVMLNNNDTEYQKLKGMHVSEYFAHALEGNLGPFTAAISSGSVERVQALLLLGLYEWISPAHEGLKAWMLFGAAGRMAQAIGLGYERNREKTDDPAPRLTELVIVEQEVRRRTMFCCFLFDRLVSCGKDRVSFIRSEDLHIMLPCSKEDFDLSRQVNTSTLFSNDLSLQLAGESTSNTLSRFIQLVDLWGKISQYSNTGGRFTENGSPPWDPASQFFRLRHQLDRFAEALQTPGTFLSWSPSNFFRHESLLSTYVLLHMLMSLCNIMLHREYIPFIAIRCDEPSGPLDEPTFHPDTVPNGFWHESSRKLFDASRTVIDLIELCGDQLPHSPLAAFVIYTAAFNGMYARHFPHMDIEHKMSNQEEGSRLETEPFANSSSVGKTKVAFDALKRLAKYSGVAGAFAARFKEVDYYFVGIIRDHYRNRQPKCSAVAYGVSGKVGIRMGGETGGLEEWVERSDEILSNSSIIKQSDVQSSRNHNRSPRIKVRDNLDQLGSDKHSHNEGNNFHVQLSSADPSIPSTQPNRLPREDDPRVCSGIGEFMASIGEAEEPLFPGNLEDAAIQTDDTSPTYTESGLDWNWAYLHDMFMGSIQMDPGSPWD